METVTAQTKMEEHIGELMCTDEDLQKIALAGRREGLEYALRRGEHILASDAISRDMVLGISAMLGIIKAELDRRNDDGNQGDR